MASKTPQPVRARVSFRTAADKANRRGRFIAAGDPVAASDPVVKKYPDFFEDFADAVERATAAPGERRATPIPTDDDGGDDGDGE